LKCCAWPRSATAKASSTPPARMLLREQWRYPARTGRRGSTSGPGRPEAIAEAKRQPSRAVEEGAAPPAAHAGAAAAGMIRSYLDTLLELPWAPPGRRISTSPGAPRPGCGPAA
jgi:hypothetical protein